MADQRSGATEPAVEMDYAEHERTYSFFLSATKWGTLHVVALLIAMAFGFFTSAGFFSAFVLFVLLSVGGFFLLR